MSHGQALTAPEWRHRQTRGQGLLPSGRVPQGAAGRGLKASHFISLASGRLLNIPVPSPFVKLSFKCKAPGAVPVGLLLLGQRGYFLDGKHSGCEQGSGSVVAELGITPTWVQMPN